MEFIAIVILIILTAGPLALASVEFLVYLTTGKRWFNQATISILEVTTIIIFPIIVMGEDLGHKNNCCVPTATFSPDHKLTLYIWIIACMSAYFYSRYRKSIAPPLTEIIVNCLLIISIVLNVFIGIQMQDYYWVFGNLPIVLLFILCLADNQKKLIGHIRSEEYTGNFFFAKIASNALKLNIFLKYPIFLILCLPIFFVLTALLILFGQRPDSAIRAFTDTYYQGFSQLNHLCENVQCGGHFLCSVAANGHVKVVHPRRLGLRNGHLIICNRQLLVANAFEELIQENFPKFHKIIRSNYNKVGNLVHKYYAVFENKYFADLIYLMMKPLQGLFLLVLYVFDKKPEDRIAKQYLGKILL